jgi:hypothetical protein
MLYIEHIANVRWSALFGIQGAAGVFGGVQKFWFGFKLRLLVWIYSTNLRLGYLPEWWVQLSAGLEFDLRFCGMCRSFRKLGIFLCVTSGFFYRVFVIVEFHFVAGGIQQIYIKLVSQAHKIE